MRLAAPIHSFLLSILLFCSGCAWALSAIGSRPFSEKIVSRASAWLKSSARLLSPGVPLIETVVFPARYCFAPFPIGPPIGTKRIRSAPQFWTCADFLLRLRLRSFIEVHCVHIADLFAQSI